MRTIRTKIYNFDELTTKAKEKAIEEVKNTYYEHNDFPMWAIDDCYLLEPKHDELIKLFGLDFYKVLNKSSKYNDSPLIKNSRELFFSLDRDKHIDISKAMQIQDSGFFLEWLGLKADLIEKIDYDIKADEIEFLNQSDEELTDKENAILEDAKQKFSNHCEEILQRIKNDIDYRYTDEAIKEDITANEFEFLADGTKYNL